MKLYMFAYSRTTYEVSHVDEFIALIADSWNDAHNLLLYIAAERGLSDDWTSSLLHVTALTEEEPEREVNTTRSSMLIRLDEQPKGYAVMSPFEG